MDIRYNCKRLSLDVSTQLHAFDNENGQITNMAFRNLSEFEESLRLEERNSEHSSLLLSDPDLQPLARSDPRSMGKDASMDPV
jgi:hypothetical protein